MGETVVHLTSILDAFEQDSDLQVVIFQSNVPDFFLNHFDLAAVGDLPTPAEGALPIWTDLVVRLTKAQFITIASIRGRTRGAGNEFAMACDLRYPVWKRPNSASPKWGPDWTCTGFVAVRCSF